MDGGFLSQRGQAGSDSGFGASTPGQTAIERLARLIEVAPAELSTLPPRHAVRLVERLEEAEASARRVSYDLLTGLYLRRPGEEALRREWHRMARSASPLAILFADIDRMKEINDGRGHAAGDATLARLGRVVRELLRPYDIGVRWGGDEVVVALVDCDRCAADKVRARLEAEFAADARASVTCGCVQVRAGEALPAVIARADADMYQLKRARQLKGSAAAASNR